MMERTGRQGERGREQEQGREGERIPRASSAPPRVPGPAEPDASADEAQGSSNGHHRSSELGPAEPGATAEEAQSTLRRTIGPASSMTQPAARRTTIAPCPQRAIGAWRLETPKCCKPTSRSPAWALRSPPPTTRRTIKESRRACARLRGLARTPPHLDQAARSNLPAERGLPMPIQSWNGQKEH